MISPREYTRRQFTSSAAGAAGAAMAASLVPSASAADPSTTPRGQTSGDENSEPVRVGFVGVGGRGTGMMRHSLGIEGVLVPAVCDVNPAAAERAQKMVEAAGQPKPEAYTRGETDFQRLMDRDDLDAVFIATPWEWHAPMAVCAMKRGKYVGVEVPAAITLDECWQLVDTSEKTGIPCMMMENWSFRRDNLAVLNMIRQGLFGQIVHCHCAHSHNCLHWYMDGRGYPRWTGDHLLARCADQYPTHSLGPVLSWMDINHGDRFETVVSMATGQWGITDQLTRRYGPDHPPAGFDWKQGDIVTTMVRTAPGQDRGDQHGHATAASLRQPLADPRHPRPVQRAARGRLPGRLRGAHAQAGEVGAFRAVSGKVQSPLVARRAGWRGTRRRGSA